MNTYIDRLYHERSDLIDKIQRLELFLEDDEISTQIQSSLLSIQLSAMRTYLDCLHERVKWINHEEK